MQHLDVHGKLCNGCVDLKGRNLSTHYRTTHQPDTFVTRGIKLGGEQIKTFNISDEALIGEMMQVKAFLGHSAPVLGVSFQSERKSLHIKVSRLGRHAGSFCIACRDHKNLPEEDAARCGMPITCLLCSFQCHYAQAMQKHYTNHSVSEILSFLKAHQLEELSTAASNVTTGSACEFLI